MTPLPRSAGANAGPCARKGGIRRYYKPRQRAANDGKAVKRAGAYTAAGWLAGPAKEKRETSLNQLNHNALLEVCWKKSPFIRGLVSLT